MGEPTYYCGVHPAKRPRIKEWDCYDSGSSSLLGMKKQGLSDLFETTTTTTDDTQHAQNAQHQRTTPLSYHHTFRMEHRHGGITAQHEGEERILIFRSDRAGACAKIVYSSTAAQPQMYSCDKMAAISSAEGNNQQQQQQEDEDSSLSKMVQAKIHVLEVKNEYRGFDFGSLLCTEAFAHLRHRHSHGAALVTARKGGGRKQPESCHASFSMMIRCQLDAEEDMRRHNRLVNFYKKLGFSIKPGARIQYLNNNDDETYRKVPMQVVLQNKLLDCDCKCSGDDYGNSRGENSTFVPIVLFAAPGRRVIGSDGCRVDWLLIENDAGHIKLQCTLRGQPLFCQSRPLVGEAGKGETMDLETVEITLMRVQDCLAMYNANPEDTVDLADSMTPQHDPENLWVIQTSLQGTFLAVHSRNQSLKTSRIPAFWKVIPSSFSLAYANDSISPQRKHALRHWMTQTVDYVMEMRAKYMSFQRKTMTLLDALHNAKIGNVIEFDADSKVMRTSSLRTRCFWTAEFFRNAGHPDWVQLVALLYHLGGMVKCWDDRDASSALPGDDYDWTIPSRAWVLGVERGLYKNHCGLDAVLLPWTGPEYMYHMLLHNETTLPEEALKMLRLASLSGWHTRNKYSSLATDDDVDAQPLVAEFDQCLRVAAKQSIRHATPSKEMAAEECNLLWETHYAAVAMKYNAGGVLMW